MKKDKGFTLLELMVCTVALAVLTSIVLTKLQSYEQNNKVIALRNNVAAVQNALISYVRTSCNANTTLTPTINGLVNLELLTSVNEASNPINNSVLNIDVNWNSPIRVIVTANMGSAQSANFYLNSSGASSVSGSDLIWEKSYSSAAGDFERTRVFSKLFETDCI